MTEANDLIDSLEADIERIRNLDGALLASLVGRLDQLRKMASARVLIAPSVTGASAEKLAESLRSVMETHCGTLRNLA
jgi:hypothetical protein